eukprot:COSAG03_NODE_7357_length_929_cov_1.608434_1_plen_48_part_00
MLRNRTAVAERVMKEDNIGLQEENKALLARSVSYRALYLPLSLSLSL